MEAEEWNMHQKVKSYTKLSVLASQAWQPNEITFFITFKHF